MGIYLYGKVSVATGRKDNEAWKEDAHYTHSSHRAGHNMLRAVGKRQDLVRWQKAGVRGESRPQPSLGIPQERQGRPGR